MLGFSFHSLYFLVDKRNEQSSSIKNQIFYFQYLFLCFFSSLLQTAELQRLPNGIWFDIVLARNTGKHLSDYAML